VELSDLGGTTFPSTPIVIGTLTSSTATSMPLTLPNGTAAGTYKVKIKSSNPVGENTGNLTIVGIPTGLPTLTKNPNIPVASGTSVTLTASDCPNGNGVMWSTGSFGTSISVSPNTTTIYTATCNNNCGQAPTSASITVEIVTPPTITPDKYSVCSGADAVLTATGCTSPDIVTWYNASTSATLGTGLTITVNPTTYTIYAAKCTRSGIQSGYSNSQGISITSPPPAPTAISKSPSTSVGPYSTVLLTVTTGGYNVKWNDGVYGNPRYVNPSTTSTYTAKNIASNSSPCESTTGISTTVTVDPILTPGIAISSPSEYNSVLNNKVCSSQNLNFSSAGCVNPDVVKWYRKTFGGTGVQIGTGTTLVTNNLSYDMSSGATIYYFATCTRGATTTPASNEVAISVTQISNPNGIIATPSGSVAPNTSVSLSSNGSCPSPSTIKWDDNSSVSTRVVTPASTTTYTLKCVNGICESTTSSLTITVNGPPVVTATLTSLCQFISNFSTNPQSTTLTATGCSSTVTWTSIPSNAPKPTGNSGTIYSQNLTQNTTYTATCNGLISTPLVINYIPNNFAEITANPAFITTPQTPIALSASNLSGTTTWYASTYNIFGGLGSETNIGTAQTTNYTPTSSAEFRVSTVTSGCTFSSRLKVPYTIAVTGLPTTALNITYSEGSGKYLVADGASGTLTYLTPSNSTFDADTYFYSGNIQTFTCGYYNTCASGYYILRKNNFWEIWQLQAGYNNPNTSVRLYKTKLKYETQRPPCSAVWLTEGSNTESVISLNGVCENINNNITNINVPAQVCQGVNAAIDFSIPTPLASYLIELILDSSYEYYCGGASGSGSTVISSATFTTTSGNLPIQTNQATFSNSGCFEGSGCGTPARCNNYRIRITPQGASSGVSVSLPLVYNSQSCPQPCSLTQLLNSPTDDQNSGIQILKASSGVGGKITATNKITGTANATYQAKSIELNPGFKADNGTVFKAEVGGCN
jgi:hypothetical protein